MFKILKYFNYFFIPLYGKYLFTIYEINLNN